MLTTRLLLIPSLVFLGSCAPLQPQPQGYTTIIINAGAVDPTKVGGVQLPPPIVATVPTAQKEQILQKVEKCHQLTLEEVQNYKLPPKPDLSNIDYRNKEKANQAITDALIDNINLLRRELERVNTEYSCTLRALQNPA